METARKTLELKMAEASLWAVQWTTAGLALAMILPSTTRVLRSLAPAAAGACAVAALFGAAFPALGFGLGIDTADLGLAVAAATVALGRTFALPFRRLDEGGREVRFPAHPTGAPHGPPQTRQE